MGANFFWLTSSSLPQETFVNPEKYLKLLREITIEQISKENSESSGNIVDDMKQITFNYTRYFQTMAVKSTIFFGIVEL